MSESAKRHIAQIATRKRLAHKSRFVKRKDTMQVCNITRVSRISWDEERIKLALNALKTHDLNGAAKRLGVGRDSLRHALSRNGISVRDFRRRAKQSHAGRKGKLEGNRVFLDSSLIGENRPFLAMEAFDTKAPNGCSWPIGDLDGDAFSFCNAPRTKGKPYCAQCAKQAYEPAPPLSSLGLPKGLLS